MKCAIYMRVSTQAQDDNYSLEVQKKKGTDFATSNGYEPIYYKDVESGSSNKRIAFAKLIKDIEDNDVNIVWVIEFSRLSRNDEEDALFIRRLFIEKQVKLYDNGTLIPFDSAEDQLFYNIRSSIAAYERRKIHQRMTAGLHQKFNKGLRVLPKVYGYDFHDGQISINQEEADVVKEVFQAIHEGKTYLTVAEDLMARGKKRKGGGTNWTTALLSKMVRQRAYISEIKAPSGDYIKSKVYPSIIDDELWVRVKKRLREKEDYTKKLNVRKGNFELSGLITCPNCGARYFRKSNIRKGKEIGFYIHETSWTEKIACYKQLDRKTITEDRIRYLVMALYLNNFSDFDSIKAFYQDEIEKVNAANQDIDGKTKEMITHQKKLEQDKQKLVDAVIAGALSHEDIKAKREEIDTNLDSIQNKIEDLVMAKGQKSQTLEDALNDFSETELMEFWDLEQRERKAIYAKRIKSINLINRSLDITFINHITYSIPDVFNLQAPYDGWYDEVETYYRHSDD